MNLLVAAQAGDTMNSVDLLSLINRARMEFGESAVRRNDFHARVRDELDGEHYETFVVLNDNGTESESLKLTIRQCMFVAMRESKGVRRQVQERLEAGLVPQVPQTMAQALRLAAEQAERIEVAQKQIAAAAPKVEFHDRYAASTGNKGFREVCKLLHANEREFREFLISARIMYRLAGELTPMAPHIDAGRFVVKAGTSQDTGHAFNQPKFTPKGVTWIAGEWAKHCLHRPEHA